MVGDSGVDLFRPQGWGTRVFTGKGTCQARRSPSVSGPHMPLSPPQRHQRLVQPLSPQAPVWQPPQHGELWQQGAQVRGAGGWVMSGAQLWGHSQEGAGPPALPLPGSTRTGRASSMTCVASWRGSTSPTQWRSGWRRMSTLTWTSCGTWCGTTKPSSASTPGPR